MALKEGGAVAPSPMQNFLNPGAQRPETKSGVKSLESLGLVGKKNVASELTEDLGLDEYKKALADAMALPLKAVAASTNRIPKRNIEKSFNQNSHSVPIKALYCLVSRNRLI
mgnify:CR=1 FL=1